MFQIIGIVLLFGLVFGSYIISGGKFEVILHALPHEMMAIGGAGVAMCLQGASSTGAALMNSSGATMSGRGRSMS